MSPVCAPAPSIQPCDLLAPAVTGACMIPVCPFILTRLSRPRNLTEQGGGG
jgi:hypothetical protein